MNLTEYVYPIKVHIEDVDFAGVIYHSNYLNYFERARSEWFDELGLGITWQREHEIYFPVRKLTAEFLSPGRLHEKLEVVSLIKSLRNVSVMFDQYLRPAQSTDKILCRMEVKLACVDYNLKPTPFPESPTLEKIRRALS